MNLIPVIISGGAGSRLWPLSRELHPKPFIPLPDGGTLIRKVYARATGLPGVGHVITVTNRELLFQTDDEYAEAPAKQGCQQLYPRAVRTRYCGCDRHGHTSCG